MTHHSCRQNASATMYFGVVATTAMHSGQSTLLHKGTTAYMDDQMNIYVVVMASGLPNFIATCIPLPSNLTFTEWQMLVHNGEDARVVDFLQFGCPVG